MKGLKTLLPRVAVVVVAVALSSFFANGGLALFKAAPSDAEIEQLLIESDVHEVYLAVRTYFPEDAAIWRDRLAELVVERRKGLYTTASAVNIGVELRQRHGHHLATAPDDLLIQVMQQQTMFHEIFQSDPDTCGRFALEGPTALTSTERQLLVPLINDSGVIFEAMHAGMVKPTRRDPSREVDWLQLFDKMRADGFNDDDIQMLIYPDASAANYCDVVIGFLEALGTADFDGADRLRAEMAVAMLGG